MLVDLDREGPGVIPSKCIPHLIEGPERDRAAAILDAIPRSIAVSSPWLSYGLGSLMATQGGEDAIEWLTGALVASRAEPRLFARVTAELGVLHLSRGEVATAEALLTWATGLAGRSASQSPDLLRLRAHLAYEAGDAAGAREHAERAIALSGRALTASTLVDALHIVAVTEASREPTRAADLSRFCLRVVQAERLHSRFALPARCVLGLSLIALGAPSLARRELDETLMAAVAAGATRERLAAAMALAIVAEFEGRYLEAARLTDEVITLARDRGMVQARDRAIVQREWLALKAEHLAPSEAIGGAAQLAEQHRARRVLRAIASARGCAPGAPQVLAALAREAADAQRNTDAVALYLHAAEREFVLGRVELARSRAAAACELAVHTGIRASPSWWDVAIVDAAQRLAPGGVALEFSRPAGVDHARHRVRLRADGEFLIGGAPVPGLWRIGRTGPRVLRRFFTSLLEVHPRGLERDELCDLLWPESEGDRAVQNLYAATADLKRALSRVPGVRLDVGRGRYALELEPSIEREGSPRA